jgi:hypothetical protein
MTQKIAALVSFLAILAICRLTRLTHAGGLEIGATAENFTLPDTDGKTQNLDGLKGKNGTVVVWLSAQCPVRQRL